MNWSPRRIPEIRRSDIGFDDIADILQIVRRRHQLHQRIALVRTESNLTDLS